MKLDRSAIAGMIAVSAAVLAGCEQRVCVDKQGRRVPEQYCGGGGSHGAFIYVNAARFGAGRVGDPAVARGGFGGEAAGHGGGSGE